MLRTLGTWFSARGTWFLDRGIVLVACLVAAAAAAYASFDALCYLGGMAGWHEQVRPALPLTIDTIAAAAGIRYARLAPTAAEARRVAFKGLKWFTAVSIIGNAIAHASMPNMDATTRVLAVAVSFIPAVGLGYVVHLLATPGEMKSEAPAPAADVPELVADERPEPEPEPDDDEHQDHDDEHQDHAAETAPIPLFPAQPRPRARHAAPRSGSIKARGLALMEEHGGSLTTTELADMLGCTTRHAQNIVNAYEESA